MMNAHHHGVALNLPQAYQAELRNIWQEFVPDCEVWAYGSRVHGLNHDASDLDLVLYCPQSPEQARDNFESLRQALAESHVPILVQILDWARIPDDFREEIKRACVRLF